MPKNVVIDSSILVSGFLFSNSKPGIIINQALTGKFCAVINDVICVEVERALKRPKIQKTYNVTDKEIKTFLNALRNNCQILKECDLTIESRCRDPDDDHVLATAVAANAHFIITGDKDLLVLKAHETAKILTAEEFLK